MYIQPLPEVISPNVGVYIDATLSMVKHIDHISHSAHLKIRRISSSCHLLTPKATVQSMCSFVLSRLDYCNSLLIDISCDRTGWKSSAKVVFRNKQTKNKHEHVRPLLKTLHWLPLKERMIFKITAFVLRFLDGRRVSLHINQVQILKKIKVLSCARWNT